MDKLEQLQKNIGYKFVDTKLLEIALRHRSLGRLDNERLEFLGDSVLGLIVSHELYSIYPDSTEGDLTRLRVQLVRKETLAAVARKINLGPFLRLGPSAGKSGGEDRSSILADALEAIVAAIFLDSDFCTAKEITLNVLSEEFKFVNQSPPEKDPKTRLQEKLQKRGVSVPEYMIKEMQGAPHERTFTVVCTIESLSIVTEGDGKSRKIAEQESAVAALSLID